MNEALEAEALLGDEAKRFLEGDLGRVLKGIAEQEIKKATLDFEEADLTDEKKIRDLQNRIWRASRFTGWLEELVERGEEALRSLEQQKRQE